MVDVIPHDFAAPVLGAAIAVDALFGDPPNAFHPVAWLGRLVGTCVRRAPTAGRVLPFVAGIGLVVFALAAALGVGLGSVALASHVHPWFGALVAVYVVKSTFALRGLLDAGGALVDAHEREGIEAARGRLSWLCSRDASALDAAGLANGTIESLAENLSDSVVAPLCAFLVFGLPGAIVYRTLNTLDAMVGYRGRYEWFGKPAARLDDLVNLVPARLTALVIALAGLALGLPLGTGLRTYAADRRRPESPNAGHPMAVTAGLLERRLDKPGVYVIGATFAPPALSDVARAVRLVRVAGGLAFAASFAGVLVRG